jgi:hypothetical protein
MKRYIILAVSLTTTHAALAREGGGLNHALPGGVVFSGLNQAVQKNAADLAFDKALAVQGTFTPKILDATANAFTASIVDAFGRAGLGATYQHNTPFDSDFSVISTAAGVGTNWISAGVTVNFQLDPSSDTSVDIGTHVGTGQSWNFGAVVRHIDDDTRYAALGVGYAEAKKWNVELDVLLPPFKTMSQNGAEYEFDLITGVYASKLGLEISGNYGYTKGDSSSSSFGVEVTGLYWVTGSVNLFVTYGYDRQKASGNTTTASILTFGATAVF